MGFLASLANAILPGIGSAIAKLVPDKNLQTQVLAAVQMGILSADENALTQQAGIITAEAKGESWPQRNWRPVTMLIFVAIIANNYILVPYVTAFGGHVPTLELSDNMWQLLKLGMGGYIVGRSGEKIAKALKS